MYKQFLDKLDNTDVTTAFESSNISANVSITEYVKERTILASGVCSSSDLRLKVRDKIMNRENILNRATFEQNCKRIEEKHLKRVDDNLKLI